MKRNIWIDYAKTFGIFLVVLGHQTSPISINGRIFSFHMPLFFFLSGILFSIDKFSSYKSFVNKRFRQIVIPYLNYSIITYIFWVLLARHFGNDASDDVPFYIPIIGILYGSNVQHFLDHDVALWFLPCLFVVENIYFLFFGKSISKYRHPVLLILFMLIGAINYHYNKFRLPWGIDIAITGVVFYALGNLLKHAMSKKIFDGVSFNLLLLITVTPIFILTSGFNLGVNFAQNVYGNYAYMYFNAILGIALFISFCKLIAIVLKQQYAIEFISKNTLSIFALQFITMGIVKTFYHFVLKYPVNEFDNKILANFILSIIDIVLMLPAIYFINNYTPWLLGKSSDS